MAITLTVNHGSKLGWPRLYTKKTKETSCGQEVRVLDLKFSGVSPAQVQILLTVFCISMSIPQLYVAKYNIVMDEQTVIQKDYPTGLEI